MDTKNDPIDFRYNKFRASLAQWTIAIANSLMFQAIGWMIAILIVVNGELHNSKSDKLSLDDSQATWFGSLMLLVQPVGCIIAGMIQEDIGRKYGMLLVNIPEIIAWTLLYTATNVNMLYASSILMGISSGLMEAPSLSYIGEVTEPRNRGTMTSFVNVNVTFGIVTTFLLGSLLEWRTCVFIHGTMCLVSIVVLFFIPESPIWLLGKGQRKEAAKSLGILRGWVTEKEIRQELDTMNDYVCQSKVPDNSNERRLWDRIRDPRFLHPLTLIVVANLCFHFVSLSGARSYIIDVYKRLNVSYKAQWLAFVQSIVMLAGGIACIMTVEYVGKRMLLLGSLIICSLGCILLGTCVMYENVVRNPWVPVFLLYGLCFSSMIGIGPILWTLSSEVFAVEDRAVGSGLSAAIYYILYFLFSVTYLDLESLINFEGCCILFGVCGLPGFIYLYLKMPETEGKTLAEIEKYFKGKNKEVKDEFLLQNKESLC